MKKVSVMIPVIWSILTLWKVYRFFEELPLIQSQARWITIGDTVCLVGFLVLAIYWWVIFIKTKKGPQREAVDE